MTPKLLAETAGMIGMKELKDAFKEVRTSLNSSGCQIFFLLPCANNNPYPFFNLLPLFLWLVWHGRRWRDHNGRAAVSHDQADGRAHEPERDRRHSQRSRRQWRRNGRLWRCEPSLSRSELNVNMHFKIFVSGVYELVYQWTWCYDHHSDFIYIYPPQSSSEWCRVSDSRETVSQAKHLRTSTDMHGYWRCLSAILFNWLYIYEQPTLMILTFMLQCWENSGRSQRELHSYAKIDNHETFFKV